MSLNTCENCGELAEGVVLREYGYTTCQACYVDALAHGHSHGLHEEGGVPEYVKDCPYCERHTEKILSLPQYNAGQLLDLVESAQSAINDSDIAPYEIDLTAKLSALAEYVRAAMFTKGSVSFRATECPSFLQTVADYLSSHGCKDVTVEYPGCVRVWAEDLIDNPDRSWWFGTANATWQGDLMNATGEHIGQSLDTGIRSDETNALIVATAIERVLTQGR